MGIEDGQEIEQRGQGELMGGGGGEGGGDGRIRRKMDGRRLDKSQLQKML